MRAYQGLAGSYDGLMEDAAYRRRASYLLRRLRPFQTEHILDLGCGTGTIACLLAAQGLRVTAADDSAEMLAQAARKAESMENPPLFIQQSMTRLRLPEPVDAVVSTIDALNYLTSRRDLAAALGRVRKWLRPGGPFLFDVNTPAKLRRMDRQVWMDETEDAFCVWRTFFSEKSGVCTYQVDLFQLRPDGAWERSFEEHRERAWERETLEAALHAAGFAEIAVYSDLTCRPPEPDDDRWQFLAI